MYRLKYYIKTATRVFTCVSEPFGNKKYVDELLNVVSNQSNYSGACIEIYVEGIGWVVHE